MDEELRKSLRVPFWCPVCQLPMKGDKCNKTYYKWDCCADCHIEFVETREERWDNGWRPDQAEIDRFIDKLHGTS